MPHDVERHVANVFRKGVVASAHEGQGPARYYHVDGSPRAGAEQYVAAEFSESARIGLASGGHQPHRVVDESGVHVDAVRLTLQTNSFLDAQDGLYGLQCARHPFNDHELLGSVRVANEHLKHETVDLRLGEGISALRLNGVLRRHNEERVWHGVGLASDGDLPLLHYFKESALNLSRGAVYLIRQQQVGEDGPQGRVELTGLLIVDSGTHQVGGHQIGSKLDALKLTADGLRERLDRHRLCQPGHAFDEDVTSR